MNPSQTEQTLDALADLFLTEPNGAGAEAAAPSKGGDGGDGGDATRRVKPVRLPPKPVMKQEAPGSGSGDDVAGFISPWGASGPPEDPTHAPDRVEAVLLGNLPGFGLPWLTQYAHVLARRSGPVAVLHADEEGIEVELVSTIEAPADVPAPTPGEPRGDQAPDLLNLLHDLSQLRPRPVRTWLIHLPGPVVAAAPGCLRHLRSWTLLSGADEAAVVGAYRMLKEMVAGDEQAAPRDVRLMIMGSDEQASRNAASNLNDAAHKHLATPIELVGSLKKMIPVCQRSLGRFVSTDDSWSGIQSFVSALEGGVTQEAEPRDDAASVDLDPAELASLSGQMAAPTIQRAPATQRPDNAAQPETAQPGPAATAESTEANRIEPAAPDAAAVPGRPSLSTLLAGEGLVAIEARCPYQPDCELAVDPEGRLQVLIQGEPAGPAATEDQQSAIVRDAVVALMETGAWVREHVELLQLSARQVRMDASAPAALHLFTDQARAAVALAGRRRDLLRLHLLQRVTVGGAFTWCCNDLN
ncbi:MAG: hypothetical protein CMJ18_20480 [Phycisphaeraceae bacterium]|nr:hypothetical protein [Phycisphaeraceae bacterium]